MYIHVLYTYTFMYPSMKYMYVAYKPTTCIMYAYVCVHDV